MLNEIEAHYVKNKPPKQPCKVGGLKGAGAEVGLRCTEDWAGYSENIRLTVADHCGVLSLNVVSFHVCSVFLMTLRRLTHDQLPYFLSFKGAVGMNYQQRNNFDICKRKRKRI